MLGVGISAPGSDLQLFVVDGEHGENRTMTMESLEIMLELWTRGPRDFDGQYWKMRGVESDFDFLHYHLRPFQQPLRQSGSPG